MARDRCGGTQYDGTLTGGAVEEVASSLPSCRRAARAVRGSVCRGDPRLRGDDEQGVIPAKAGISPATAPPTAAPVRKPRALAVAPFPTDPVCGMPVNPAEARHTLVVGAETLYFCCPHCKAAYRREHEPARGERE
jgi:YHS domain-containing protein